MMRAPADPEEVARRRLRDLVSLLSGCGQHGDSYRGLNNYEPAKGSNVYEQSRDESFGAVVAEGFKIALLRFSAAESQLAGLARLISPPPEGPFPIKIVARAAAEASARAAYFLEPNIAAQERAARQHNDRAETLKRSIQVSRDDEERDKFVERREQLWLTAEESGHTVVRRSDRPLHVDKALPNATHLLARLFQDDDEVPLGAVVHRYLSGVMHASPSALVESYAIEDEEIEPDVYKGQLVTTMTEIEVAVRISCLAWVLAFDNLIISAGWERGPWLGWRGLVFDRLRPSVEELRDQGK